MYRCVDDSYFLAMGILGVACTFMFEFSYFNDITDNLKNFGSTAILIVPVVIGIVVQFLSTGVSMELFYGLLIFLIICTFDIMLVRLFYTNEHELFSQIDILMSDIGEMEEDKNELINFRNRVEKVNEELNYQRVQLSQMNKEIEKANDELSVQAELMQFINNSMSLRIPQVMEHMIEEIMRVQRIEFCGIYVDRGICYNRKPHFRYSYREAYISDGIDEMRELYQFAMSKKENRIIIQNIDAKTYPDFAKHEIKNLMVLPLKLDGEIYGALVCGRNKAYDFSSTYRFFDIAVPQINLAVKNIKMYSSMKHMAETDGLTQINNRVHFNELFKEQIKTTIEENSKLSVALFDIDKFKRINDTYGHLVGDEVIKTIASIANYLIEEQELGFICRYGGEEFVVALPGKGVDEALPIIESLHKAIRETVVECYDQQVTMNVSIGLTSYPEICKDPQELLKRADWSMYYAKEHGRGQIKVDGDDVVGEE